ncbi:hypothetical protein ACWPKS_15845 [Coraliomargarita sp. W4R72]
MKNKESTPKTPDEIRAALLSKGQTIAGFARLHDFNIHTVRATVYGSRSRGKKVAAVQAKLEEVLSV